MPETPIGRRAAIRLAAQGASAVAAASTAALWGRTPARAVGQEKAGAAVTVRLREPIGTIRPAVHGQFAEHIGGVIYDGIWVGRDSKIPNVDGIRRDIIDHLKRLGPVVVRWPGGCFADRYHWRDGIGPAEKRPRRFGRWREQTETNAFGTHEFLRFCKLAGVEPYLAANVGSGSVEEYQQWVEYCNAPAASTTLADERAANGSPAPFGVKYWGVGNESWGCGGKFTPEDYCTEYRKFTEWVPSYGVPLYQIAAGPNGNDVNWTKRFFAKWADYAHAPIQGWAPHYYCGTTGHALNFNRDQWYEMLSKADQMETLIRDQWKAIGEFDKGHAIKLVIDEWGAWHPEGTGINPRHQFEQMGCLRDALVAALTLDTFHRHAEKVDMANVAQLVNNIHSLFLADGDQFVATPNFHVFAMYRAHQNGKSLRIDVEAPSMPFKAAGRDNEVFRVAGSASLAGQSLTLTLVHTHATEPIEVDLNLADGKPAEIKHTVLTHDELNAHNTFAKPNVVVPRDGPAVAIRGASVRLTLPPASVNRFDVRLG